MTREQFISHVESHQKAFRRLLTALCCGDTALADDIAQEAFIKAYLSCEGFRDDAKFTTWIYRIGFNTFLNHRRSARLTATYDEVAASDSGERADDSFRYQELYAALDRIPERERTSILLHYMEGYSVSEIAEIVEVSADAVKQHLSRGRRHLRGILNDKDHE